MDKKADAKRWDKYVNDYNYLTELMKKAGIDPKLLDNLIESAKMI